MDPCNIGFFWSQLGIVSMLTLFFAAGIVLRAIYALTRYWEIKADIIRVEARKRDITR